MSDFVVEKVNHPAPRRPQRPIPLPEPITTSIDGARFISGLSRSFLYELITSGKLRTIQIGTRRLVYMSSLRELLRERGD